MKANSMYLRTYVLFSFYNQFIQRDCLKDNLQTVEQRITLNIEIRNL